MVGVLVQCNYGSRRLLRIAGAPVGAELAARDPICYARRAASGETRRWPFPDCEAAPAANAEEPRRPDGSIIIVVATDAPLLPHQLRRLAKRPSLGLGRLGSVAGEGSGDIFIAFSTANPGLRSVDPGPAPRAVQMYSNDLLTPLFEATTQATEEAIVNAMIAAETMEGADGVRVPRLPHEGVRESLRRYGRLVEPAPRAGDR
jgi:L-aminopeptidase/D-esterase-like protein